ncbi:MAG: hypothetical protein J5896_01800 [Alphaproteobacteria bacterium]|nr:hypothetical protein [Alphaproteobacteria bacterium]
MLLALICLILSLSPYITFAQETESIEIRANACEKMISGESLSGARNRAVDKAVFLGLKNVPDLARDQALFNDHDFTVMIYRLVDDFVEDLTSKVTKSDENKVCVDIVGYINPSNIESVKNEFKKTAKSRQTDGTNINQIVQSVDADLKLKPQNMEDLALVYIEPFVYFNGKTSLKYTAYLTEKLQNNAYYFLTEKKDLADYIITPKLLKAKPETLDADHKRIQMVVAFEISGLQDDVITVLQNRFLLYGANENQNDIVSRLLEKLIDAASLETSNKIERNEQKKLEEKAFGHTL